MKNRAMLMVFLGSCSYGILSTIVKLAYNAGFTVEEVTGIQLFLGAVTFWLIVGVQNIMPGSTILKERVALPFKTVIKLIFMGIPIGLTSMAYYLSVQYVPASIAILFLFQFTWIGMIMESITSGTFPSRLQIVSLVLLLGGTCLATGIVSQGFDAFNFLGVFFGLLSGLSYAFFIFVNDHFAKEVRPLKRNQWMLTGAVLINFIIFPPHFLFDGALANGLLIYGIPLALFGAIIPPFLYTIGVPRIGVGLASILSAVELPVAVTVAALVLKELVTISQWFGLLIILLGIFIPNYGSFKKNTP